MTFVVIGGGPTGVEMAGELRIIAQHGMKRGFRKIDPRDAQVILLDAGERVTAAFSERLSGKVAKELASLGVTVREGARVTAIDAQGVTASVNGADERIDARTVIWAAGVQAVGFSRVLAEATGASTDRAGRVQIEPDLTIAGPSRDLGDRRYLAARRARRKAVPGTGDGRDPAGTPHGEGDPQGGARRIDPVSLPRQGGAGSRRSRQGRV